jgi:hypothetical protein
MFRYDFAGGASPTGKASSAYRTCSEFRSASE